MILIIRNYTLGCPLRGGFFSDYEGWVSMFAVVQPIPFVIISLNSAPNSKTASIALGKQDEAQSSLRGQIKRNK